MKIDSRYVYHRMLFYALTELPDKYNGCRVEALQPGDVKKLELELALSIHLVVSWRLAHLTRLGRIHPELPVSEVFDQVRRISCPKRRWGARCQNALAGLRKSQQLRCGH